MIILKYSVWTHYLSDSHYMNESHIYDISAGRRFIEIYIYLIILEIY